MYIHLHISFEWDEAKRRINIDKHGVDFSSAYQLWDSPMLIMAVEHAQQRYGELRWIGMGCLDMRVMLVVFTRRLSNIIRIISLRKANRKEAMYYEQAISQHCQIHIRRNEKAT